MSSESSKESQSSTGRPFHRLAALIIVVGAVAALYWQFHDVLSLQGLAERETQFRRFSDDRPVLVYGLAFCAYVLVTALSLPGAAAMTLTFAWLFGFWTTLPLVSFASTAGASVAFLFSRYVLRDWVQSRFSDRLQSISESFESEGAFYLFTLRLIPAIPFFVINLVMGITSIRLRTFWWVSQVGMLPGTLVYIYAGSQVPDLVTLAEQGVGSVFSAPLIAAFVMLGLFPLTVRKIVRSMRGDSTLPDPPDSNAERDDEDAHHG